MVRSVTNKSPAVVKCQTQGMTQRETAEKLEMSLSWVQTHWERSATPGRPSYRSAVKALIAEGKTDKEIAKVLNISVSTANRHRHTGND
jgi:DNA-binding NarL/FixJ family response regulator